MFCVVEEMYLFHTPLFIEVGLEITK